MPRSGCVRARNVHGKLTDSEHSNTNTVIVLAIMSLLNTLSPYESTQHINI